MATRDVFNFRPEDPYEYFFEAGKRYPARVVRGREALSEPFRFEMRFRFQSGEFPPPSDMVGSQGVVIIERGGIALRRIRGYVSDVSISATGKGDPELVLVVEPRIALMRLQSDLKVFRDMTVPQIVRQVLEDEGISTGLRLSGTYRVRPYTVMYNETLHDFVHRLLEDEGIFYFVGEQLDLEDEDSPEIVLCDGIQAYEPIEGDHELLLKSTAGMARPEEGVFDLSRRARMRPGKVSLRDWNLETPSLPMDVSAELPRFDDDTVHGPELYDYPGKYETPGEGQRKAQLMAEAIACSTARLFARSDTARLLCGRTFKLTPDQAFADQGLAEEELVVIVLEHEYRRAGEDGAKDAGGPTVNVRFQALPASVGFRPERRTPLPLITNPLTGIVTGPEGEDIHCDSFGRVKVLFQWDRYQPKDDTCSHWIPVLQENTGTSSSIPRIGWEVVVAFIDGDPDRPYVLGRVYNAGDTFPEPLPASKTKTALRSLSSPGRDGSNEVWIEDATGRELMSLQAEKDQNVVVANDKNETIGNFEENTVIKDETIEIGNNNTVTVAKQAVLAVDGSQSIAVAAARTRKVSGAEQSTVTGKKSMVIGGSHIRKIGGHDDAALTASLSETTGGVEIEASLKQNATNAGLLQTLTVGGAVVEVAGQGKEERSDMIRVETIGALLFSFAKTNMDFQVKIKRATTVLTNLTAKIVDNVLLKSDDKLKGKIGKGDLKSAKVINITVGKNTVVIDDKGISMTSDGNVELVASGKNDLVGDEVGLN